MNHSAPTVTPRQVLEVRFLRGTGTAEYVLREVTAYYDADSGDLLAEVDPHPPARSAKITGTIVSNQLRGDGAYVEIRLDPDPHDGTDVSDLRKGQPVALGLP